MIPAHDSPLAALAFDASGTKLATASEKVCLTAMAEGSPQALLILVTQSKFQAGFSVPQCTEKAKLSTLLAFHPAKMGQGKQPLWKTNGLVGVQ